VPLFDPADNHRARHLRWPPPFFLPNGRGRSSSPPLPSPTRQILVRLGVLFPPHKGGPPTFPGKSRIRMVFRTGKDPLSPLLSPPPPPIKERVSSSATVHLQTKVHLSSFSRHSISFGRSERSNRGRPLPLFFFCGSNNDISLPRSTFLFSFDEESPPLPQADQPTSLSPRLTGEVPFFLFSIRRM